MDPVWFIENFREHYVELGQFLLALVYWRLWKSVYDIMKDGPLWFSVLPHKDRAVSHHLEVGPFPSNFIFSSVPVPFLRYDEELGSSREVVNLFKIKVVKFTCVVFQVQDDGAYFLGLDDPPNAIEFCIVSFS